MENESIKELHVGKLIRKYVDEKGINQAAQERRSGVKARDISYYFKKSSIQISALVKVSLGFKYNFLRQVADMLPAEYPPGGTLQAQIDALTKENEDLKKENATLKELLKKG